MIWTKFSGWKHYILINLAAKDRFNKAVPVETVTVSGLNQCPDGIRAYFICL